MTFACKDKTTTTISFLKDTAHQLKPDTSTKQNQDKDTIKFHLQFDTSKTLLDNIYSGWIDTFSIEKQSFRLKFDTATNSYENICVEQLTNGNWKKLFGLFFNSDEYGKEDINQDGYVDFVKFYHARHYIYFYNPVRKTLSDTAWIMPEENQLLNKQNLTLYNYYEAMYGNTYPSSQLYTYKDRQPVFLYELLFIENDSLNIQKMNLYKFLKGKFNDTLFIKTVKAGKNIKFNYKEYWQKNYKDLLGYR